MSSAMYATGAASLAMEPDVNRGPLLQRAVWVLLGLSTVVILGRLLVKCKTTRRLYYDDLLMLLALGFGYAHAVTISISVSTGLGRHIYYLSDANYPDTLRVGFFSLAWGFLSPLAGRLGFMVFLLFVAGTDPLIKKWWLYVFMSLQLVINVVAVIVAYAWCGNELYILWNPKKQDLFNEKCFNPVIQTNYGYFQGSFNTLTDLFLTILPALIVWHTKLSFNAKIATGCLLCLSILAMVASIVKTYEAKALSEVFDYTYDLIPYVLWMSIELNVVMIVATIPLLRPLFRRDIFSFGRNPRMPRSPMISSISSRPRKGWENITMDSIVSKKEKSQTRTSEVPSSASDEDILASRNNQQLYGITRTLEVEITYEPNDKPFVHAALVGLCPGTINNRGHAAHVSA
ncbi:MAG: hypothetical protein M1820_008501 [Bogoriella megaspora]|nr:MAG: hypothetical protein M1820_008501 [Bogoriella megaspora]